MVYRGKFLKVFIQQAYHIVVLNLCLGLDYNGYRLRVQIKPWTSRLSRCNTARWHVNLSRRCQVYGQVVVAQELYGMQKVGKPDPPSSPCQSLISRPSQNDEILAQHVLRNLSLVPTHRSENASGFPVSVPVPACPSPQ